MKAPPVQMEPSEAEEAEATKAQSGSKRQVMAEISAEEQEA